MMLEDYGWLRSSYCQSSELLREHTGHADGVSDAATFLPKPRDIYGNPWMTCHFGPHDQQHPVHLRIFNSLRMSASAHLRFQADGVKVITALRRKASYSPLAGQYGGLDWCPYPETKAAGRSLPHVPLTGSKTSIPCNISPYPACPIWTQNLVSVKNGHLTRQEGYRSGR